MWAAHYPNPINNIENCCIYQAVMKQRQKKATAKPKTKKKATAKPKTKKKATAKPKTKKKATAKKLLSSVKLQQKAAGYMLAAANAIKRGR